MKKHLHNSLRALFLSLAVLLSLPLMAADVEIDGVNYKLNAETKQATVIKKSSGYYSGSVVIPESVEFRGVTHSVTSIGDEAFYNCSGLTSVTIPKSVTSTGRIAFLYCSRLTSVHISDIAAWCNIDFYTDNANPLYYAHHLYINGEEVKDLVIPNSVKSIGDDAFNGCSSLTSVTIPNSVTRIGGSAFANCTELLDVYCYAENVPSTSSGAFNGSYPEYITLHVPVASVDSYKATAPWSGFGKIVGLSGEETQMEKCATPVVTYVDGCLEISCETEGAEFVTDIADSDIKKHYVSKIELSATYNIEVFAYKANCENSDTVSVALVWVENGDVSEDTGVISVESTPVLITCCNGTINVCGGKDGTKVAVYTTSGVAVGNTTIINGNAVINTSLTKGDIAIVNIAGKGIKVVMQ